MKPQAPTKDPRQKWKSCPKCGEHDWFYGSKAFCRGCRDILRQSPEFLQKRTAQQALKSAVRDGKLVRQPCEACAKNGHVQYGTSHGHHEDYSKPLEVIWLCSLHHRWVHASRRSEVLTATPD
jgi:hypothetical protein